MKVFKLVEDHFFTKLSILDYVKIIQYLFFLYMFYKGLEFLIFKPNF